MFKKIDAPLNLADIDHSKPIPIPGVNQYGTDEEDSFKPLDPLTNAQKQDNDTKETGYPDSDDEGNEKKRTGDSTSDDEDSDTSGNHDPNSADDIQFEFDDELAGKNTPFSDS